MLFLYILLGLLTLCYFVIFRKKPNGKPIPGPHGLPIVGKGLEITSKQVHEKLNKYATQYGDIVQVKIFLDNVISLNSADLIRKAFNEDPYKRYMNDRSPTYWGKHVLYDSESPVLYPNTFGGIHGDLRKGMTRALHVYGDGIQEFENRITRELHRLHTTIDELEGKDFEFGAVIKRSLSNVIAFLLSGEDLKDGDDDVDLFWKLDSAGEHMLNIETNAVLLAFPFLTYFPGFYRQIHEESQAAKNEILRKYFTDMKNTHKPGVIRGIVDFFLEEQVRESASGKDIVYTDERIMNSVLDTIAAGIITSLTALTSTVLCLLHHTECQERLQKELDQVIDGEKMPSISDRANCPYLEAIMTESLRYLPVAPLLLPHVCQKELEFEGYHVPAGSQTIPNVWYVHHNEAVWGDPWTFRPDRWLDNDGQALPSSHPLRKHWIPFGTGRRQCLGEQFARNRVFLYLASLFKRYKFTATPGKCGPCDPRKGGFDISSTMRPKPYFCTAVRR